MTVPLKKVSPKEIRELFNSGGYAQKVQDGELSTKNLRDGHPSPASSGEPPCTRSQIIAYLDHKGRRRVAIVHQYLRRDGKLGASGKPDPKKLFHDAVLHVVR
jgi:hypothetical protein